VANKKQKSMNPLFDDDRTTWKARFEYWSGVKSWTASECALLINNLDPRHTPDFFKDFEESEPRDFETAQDDATKLLWKVQDSFLMTSRLIEEKNSSTAAEEQRISVTELVQWISLNNISVSDEFSAFANEHSPAKIGNEVVTVKQLDQHRVIAVAKALWGKNPEATIKGIARDILESEILESQYSDRRLEQWIAPYDPRSETEKKYAGGRPSSALPKEETRK